MTPSAATLADRDARARISSDLDETLVVEAGAGTGKTTALVDRITALVRRGTPIRAIAAITFTEAAAAELRGRLHHRLQHALEHAGTPGERSRFGAALVDLDGAAIGTVHGFAQRILTDYALDAGLPPAFSVLDDAAARAEFERRWRAFHHHFFEDPTARPALRVLLSLGVTPTHLRTLAGALHDGHDRLGPTPVLDGVPELALDEALTLAEDAIGRADRCLDHDDTLFQRLVRLAAHVRRVRAAHDEIERLQALLEPGMPRSFAAANCGRAAHWPDDTKAEIVRLLDAAEQQRAHAVERVAPRRCRTSPPAS